MSSQEPENPRPNLPGQDPQPRFPWGGGYSYEAMQERASEGATSQGVDAASTLRAHLEGLSSLSDKFIANFKEFGTLATTLAGDLSNTVGQANKLGDATAKAADSMRLKGDLTRKDAENLRRSNQEMQRSAAFAERVARVEKEIANARRGNVTKLAEEAALFEKRSGTFRVPGREGTVDRAQFERVIRGEEGTPEERRNIAALIAVQREDQMRGRKGMQPGFRLGDMIKALTSGNFGAAAGELMQRGRTGEILGRAGEEMRDREGAGMLARLGGRSLLSLSALARPASLLVAQQAYTRGIAQYNEARQIGMLTGEGAGAGFAARGRAFVQGLNPLDLLSGGQALEMQREARSRGFRGQIANAVSQTVGDVFNDLGTDWKEVMDLADVSIRRGGMSLGEFRRTMMSLDDTAKETGNSVAELQKALSGFVSERVAAGGTAAGAGVQLTGLERALGIRAGGRGGEVAAAFLQAAGPMIAVTAGLPPALAATMTPQQVAASVDKLIEPWVRSKPDGMPWRTWGAYVSMWGVPIFTGMTPRDIAIVLESWSKKGGFARAIQTQNVEGGINRARGEEDRFSTNYDQSLTRALNIGVGGSEAKVERLAGRERTAEKRYIRTIEQQLRASGVSQAEIDSMLSPIRGSRVHYTPGHEYVSDDEFRRQQTALEERLRTQHIEIKMNPHAKQYFDVTNPGYSEALRGQRPKQGTVRTPGG